jgi:Fe-S oxidoreductase
VHEAVRTVLRRMNITVVEPKATRTKAVCCGDSSYGLVPVERVRAQMALRASQMPAEDVVVYCVSCVKAMFNGGKRPRYLVDLLFGESTVAGALDPDA